MGGILMRDEVIFFMDLVPSAGSAAPCRDEFDDPVMVQQLSDAVYEELKSISQSEFYQAQTAGVKPEIKFVITDYLDYQGQKYLIHGGMRYCILRTYRTRSRELEITCYGGVRDADSTISDKSD